MTDPDSKPAGESLPDGGVEETIDAGRLQEDQGEHEAGGQDEPTFQPEQEHTFTLAPDPTSGQVDATQALDGRTWTAAPTGLNPKGLDPTGLAPTGQLSSALKPGTRVGSYRLVRQVGKGAQGSVWHAFNEVAERDFALKFINSEPLRAKWALSSIRSEANVLFDLTHSAIVRLNNIEQVGQHLFLVMELLEGPSLQEFQSARRTERGVDPPTIDVEECLWILEQLAPALDYAASEGVTHRDIKPGNLMLTRPVEQSESLASCAAEVKLCDFGIAFVETEVEPGAKVSPTGTPPYMAPEVIEGEVPTRRADVYSLAATLCALYMGESPHRGRSLVEILDKVKKREIPPLETGDKAFDAAIARALSVDPLDRQDNFDDFLFEASGGKLGLRAASRSRSYRLLAAASMVLALGAVAYALDPFGLRRGQAAFVFTGGHGERDGGTVVTEAAFLLPFDFRSPGDETVSVVVDAGPPIKVLPVASGEDRYELSIDLDSDGLHEVTVLTEDGTSLLGQARFFLDRTIELPDQPIEIIGEPPFDRSRPIRLAFHVAEDDVTIRDVSEVPALLLALDFSERRARHDLSIAAEENSDAWMVTRTFQFRDRHGNATERSATFEVYDGLGILTRLRSEFPGGKAGLHLWDLKSRAAAIAAWQVRVLDAPIPRDTARSLIEERRSDIDDIQERTATPPERALALDLTGGSWFHTRAEDGSDVIFARTADLTLVGTTENSRSNGLEARVDGEGVVLQGTPVIDRDSGAFGVTLSLASDADAILRLGLPESGPRTSTRILRDDRAPAARLDTPKPRAVLRSQQVDIMFAVSDERSGIASVTLIEADGVDGTKGAETAMERDEIDGLWRRSAPLSREGENRFRVRAEDRAGNVIQEDFTFVRDTLAPVVAREHLPSQGVTTGKATRLQWQFDEPIGSASAQIEFTDADGSTVTAVAATPSVDGASVELLISPPFRPLERLSVELTVEDGVGNQSTIRAGASVAHDPWGAVPGFIRNNADHVLDADELRTLVGDDLATDAYINDGQEWYPRCIRDRRSGIDFVYVKAGTFEYGPPGRGRTVSMRGFYLARTEVSGRHFMAGADIEGYSGKGHETSDLPIRTTRDDAGRWCGRLEFVLPTEAQWEYAASGPTNRIYPWGNEPNESLRNGPSKRRTDPAPPLGPVVAFDDGRSWCGALQMSGNLAEICRDALEPGPDVEPKDPVGPPTRNATGYVIRGGSRQTAKGEIEMTYSRLMEQANYSRMRNGFRPVWPVRERR